MYIKVSDNLEKVKYSGVYFCLKTWVMLLSLKFFIWCHMTFLVTIHSVLKISVADVFKSYILLMN